MYHIPEDITLSLADVPECTSTSCINGGSCKEVVNGGIICVCPAGFRGSQCEVNIDDCDKNPCAHGGKCVDGVNSFTCECPQDSPWTGKLCNEGDCQKL